MKILDKPKPALHEVSDPQAEAVIQKAIKNLGGEKYLNVKTQIGRGRFSVIRDGAVISFQTFTDVIVYPDKERTDFKGSGVRSAQVNIGDTGWVYDGDQEAIREQTPEQIENFRRGIRVSLDNLLRGHWKGDAELTYVGRRQATLGKRNDVLKLIYKDGMTVEFEFTSDEAIPVKAIYSREMADGSTVKEEDRYAQFHEFGGIGTPFIIDRTTDGKPTSRINYESIEFNKKIPDSVFAKPKDAKSLKKGIKL